MKAALTVVIAASVTPLFSSELDFFQESLLQRLDVLYDALRLLYILLALMLGTMWFLVMRSK
jgi:hypothetical protein